MRSLHPISSRQRAGWLTATAVALLVVGEARPDEPMALPNPLFAAVREAGQLPAKTQKTAVKGFHDPKNAFAETPDGYLIGFDCGIGKFLDIDTIYALRAIYCREKGPVFGQEHGLFTDRKFGPNKTLKSRVLRTVRLQAPTGYAVGRVTIRTGLNINGLALTYLKLDGQRLDPGQALASKWVGDRTGGSESAIGGDGAIIIGIIGSQNDTHLRSLGLIGMKPPIAPLEQLAANPPEIEHVHPPQAAEDDGPQEPAEVVDRPAVKAPKPARATSWLPIALFVIVGAAALAASLLSLNTRKRPVKRTAPRQPDDRQTESVAPSATDPSAICAQPRASRTTTPAEPLPSTGIHAGLPKPPLPLAISAGPDSRGPTICVRCARTVAAEQGAPPWCSHCGGDLKRDPHSGDASHFGPRDLLQPPYFVGRADRTYRIYIVPSRLLFLNCPMLDERSGTEKTIRGMSIQGGLIGMCIGGMIAGAIGKDRQARARDRHWTLDMADEQDLVGMAEREGESFAIDLAELRDIRIEALTFWQRMFSERCAARLHFLHPVRGPLVIDLPRPDDARVAIKQLTTQLGEQLDVNARWDWGKQRFVPKESHAKAQRRKDTTGSASRH